MTGPDRGSAPDPETGPDLLVRFLGSQQLGYLLSGGASIMLDVLTLGFLHGILQVDLGVAASAGYVTGLLTNFALNRWAVFRSASSLQRSAARYVTLVAGNYLATLFGVIALNRWGVNYLLARGALAGCTVCWNFVAYRKWVFPTE